MGQFNRAVPAGLFLVFALGGCDELVPRDMQSLFFPGFYRSEFVGFLAGLGTTFAALPDLFAMLRRRSSAGMSFNYSISLRELHHQHKLKTYANGYGR